MDIGTIALLVAIILTIVFTVAGAMFGGFTGALILGTLALIGCSFIPASPIIPIWFTVLIIVVEIILIAYKMSQGFGLGKSGE